MMLLLPTLLAASLSLASTNDYRFLIPRGTNLTGVTYITEGGVIPRYEDIAFLREAFTERNEAIGASFIDVDVPDSFAFSTGEIERRMSMREWFSPSFGLWGGFTRYQYGYFVRPGIFIEPDFQETCSNFLWHVGNDTSATNGIDTSVTNGIRAFVDPVKVTIPTNSLAFTVMDFNSDPPTNVMAFAELSGAPSTNVIHHFYNLLTNDVWILSNGFEPLGYGTWTIATSRTSKNEVTTRHQTQYINSDYSYTDSKGRLIYSKYTTGYVLSPWETTTYTLTNREPISTSSIKRYYATRSVYRDFGYRYNDYGSEKRYTINALPDWESYRQSYNNILGFSGTVKASCPILETKLTNTIDRVRCIVVAQVRLKKEDMYYGYSSNTNNLSTNRYFVVVQDGESSRYDVHPTENGHQVWDTGVDIMTSIDEIFIGLDYQSWIEQVSAPIISYENPDQSDNIPQSISAEHTRQIDIYLDGLFVYFYLHRNWNAKLINGTNP